MRRVFASLAAALLGIALHAKGQVFGPSGSTFKVNTITTGNQYTSAPAMDGAGRFMVVWRSPDGDTLGGFGRRFLDDTTPVDATEFRINSNTTGLVSQVRVAGHGTGTYVAVWDRQHVDTTYDTYGQRYDSAGELGGVFHVNTSTPVGMPGATVASDSSGNFVVVWHGALADGIVGQRYASGGAALGGEFRVNSTTITDQFSDPAVARAPGGNFVAVWERNGQVFARRFASAGGAQGAEFRVDTDTTGFAGVPRVAAIDTGFVVVWENGVTGSASVKASIFDGTGTLVGAEFRVDTATTGYALTPVVGMDGGGAFVVAWESTPDIGLGAQVVAQRFTSTGTRLGAEFMIGTGNDPALAMHPLGKFVVTWDTGEAAGAAVGLEGRLYCSALAGDVDASNTIDVADVFYLINTLFASGPAPATGSGDVNGDGNVDIADVFFLINYLFAGGAAPSCKPAPV
jgi:hypothetical protein